jgi:hypothetical protein
MRAGCLIYDGCGKQGNWVRMYDFLDSGEIPQHAWSMDVSDSTGTNRWTMHYYGNGEQVSEGVVVGLGL